MTWSFDAFFDLRLNKRLSKQSSDLRRHRAHYDLTVMHISSVIKISFCRISFSGHQNKFCACLDSIYGSRVILVMCKNCSAIRWHRLNSNQSKSNCPKNLNSDGLIVREMGPWPECIFRSLLQFLVYIRAPRATGEQRPSPAGSECSCNRPGHGASTHVIRK